ncbi:family 43 glycosylhydrolase [Paenibacillus sp. LHD-38]|uniref:family 43 glycosylhydrolase n=1 Tax=Paenibacillus sp. LHD-38 TaxID=3072143 RepID=UPI00280DD850|nr:family 43 glycosylhydrolase [Paenibacillus sp. LHD-38]MDQ8733139.1 family 43 glycosylhydrolase [Paenibacillus sp. LHD-38]
MNKTNHDTGTGGVYNGHGGTFKNTLALIDTPDPSILYQDGYYYMTFTHNGTDIMIMKSRTLDFHQAERKVVWYPPIDTMYSANLWAPEIQYIQGKYYIYFAADNGNNENHRMYALESETDDPMGSYAFKGQVTDSTNKWAIDGLTLEHDDRLYFVWSGWEGDMNIQQNTYIAPMSNPYTISGPRVLLSEPDLDWEKAGGPPFINEGQAILKKDGRLFIAYSGAGSWTPFYSIGLLELDSGADPLDASKWKKAEEPLMQMNGEAEVYGPGHNTFVRSPDGTEDWIVYHATSGQSDGWNNRKARAQRIEWQADGMPAFGKPLALNTAIEVPAGSGIFLAEHGVSTGEELLSFSGIPSTITAKSPLLMHYTNESEQALRLQVGANGAAASEIILPPTKPNEVGYVYAELMLDEGLNRIDLHGEYAIKSIIAVEVPRFEAEYAQLSIDSELMESPLRSNGRSVLILKGIKEAIRFDNVRVPVKGTYTIRLNVANPTGIEQQLQLEINGGGVQKLTVPAGERDQFAEIEASVKLNGSSNTLNIGDATGQLEVDVLDIISAKQ